MMKSCTCTVTLNGMAQVVHPPQPPMVKVWTPWGHVWRATLDMLRHGLVPRLFGAQEVHSSATYPP